VKRVFIISIIAFTTSCSTEINNPTLSIPTYGRVSVPITEDTPIIIPSQTFAPTLMPYSLSTNTSSFPPKNPTLNPEGPHILSDRILLTPDGLGTRIIEFPEEFGLGKYSPDGEWRVLYSGGYVGDMYSGGCIDCEKWTEMSLSLMHIPDGKIIQVAKMTTRAIMDEKHNWGECGLPISELLDVKWSPDGRFLAFIADPVGSSMDLFTYDTDQHILRRLTNPGIADVLDISWSPDGKKIFYINGVELDREAVSVVGNYKGFTINSQSPTDNPDQGIQTFYTGKEKPTILWMNNENDLIYITKKYYACISGSTEVALSHINLTTEKINTIWPESFIFDVSIDSDHQFVLFEVGKELSTNRNSYLTDFDGNILAHMEEPFAWCKYFGDSKYNFLCISMDRRKLFGVSLAGKAEEMTNLPDPIQGLGISPERNWFLLDHDQGIDIYSREALLVQGWKNAAKKFGYLWEPDEKGLYFVVEERKLYYWPLSTSTPSLIFECQYSINCLGNILMWVNY
jgi:WD40 repeat protein